MKKTLLRSLSGLLVVGFLALPSVGFAQSTTTTAQINSITALLEQIRALQSQIEALKASQNALKSQIATEFNAFATTLSLGSEGDAVLALQALLAANPEIYPEGLITGYFGKATEQALKRLQKQNGLEQAGVAGPRTRALLNKLLKDNPVGFENREGNATSTNRGKRPCAKVPPGHTIAPGWLKKNDGVRPIVPECQTLPPGIVQKGDNWKPGTTTRDMIAPIVSNISASVSSSTAATISFNTNEPTFSILWYSTSTPINTSTANAREDSNWKTVHSYSLSTLSPNTTYYYVLKVVDKSSNFSTTSEQWFTTPN